MKKSDTRELLLITKAAEHWEGDFNKNVDDLMDLVNRVDTAEAVLQCVEVLDVYQNTSPDNLGKSKHKKRRPNLGHQKPFEFLAFRN